MKIKKSDQPFFDTLNTENFFNVVLKRRNIIIFFASCCSLAFVGFVCFIIGAAVYDTPYRSLIDPVLNHKIVRSIVNNLRPYSMVVKGSIKENVKLPINYWRGLTSQVEKLTIDIKHKNFQRIAFHREKGLKQKFLYPEDKVFVPASIRYGGETIKIKLRLKGDNIDHIFGQKWSYRIKTKGEKTIMGMKQFSVHHPNTRGYLNIWIFHQLLKREGLIALRYHFVNLIVNGKDMGIYGLEESFEKRLIEYNKRKEGPILKFNEDQHWMRNFQSNDYSFATAPIEPFQKSRTYTDKPLLAMFLKARSLLEKFRRGEVSASQVFDIDQMAIYYAISDLTGAEHGTRWINERFYYNPVTSLLEPIGFDGDAGVRISKIFARDYIEQKQADKIGGEAEFRHLIFNSKPFLQKYFSVLERVSKKKYFDQFLADVGPDLKRQLNKIYYEFPYYHFSTDVYYSNQEVMQKALKPFQTLRALLSKRGSRWLLEVGSLQLFPVTVESVVLGDTEYPVNLRLERNSKKAAVTFISKELELPIKELDMLTLSHLKIKYKISGTTKSYTDSISPGPSMQRSLGVDFLRQTTKIRKINFLRVKGRDIFFKKGVWFIKNPLIFPPGYRIYVQAGTKIVLSKTAPFISFSPLFFQGSKKRPIIITADKKGAYGLLVIKAKERSVLKNVIFRNLSNPKRDGLAIPAAVSFYESPVDIDNCLFENNQSEDALNIVRSEFSISNSLFRDIYSDAFDSDFSNGRIVNTKFINVGNDAIDVSGSLVELEGITIKNFGDKGISVGELSIVKAKNVYIVGGEIAVASKDNSKFIGVDIKIDKSKVALAAYQKKPEFGPALIDITHLRQSDVEHKYLLENRSIIKVDDKVLATNADSLKNVFYGVKFGKQSTR